MTITRRHFLGSATGALLLAGNERRLCSAEPARRKSPFRLLYSNDLTNIASCVSPFQASDHGPLGPHRSLALYGVDQSEE